MFKKGVSGNPAGRPKGAISACTAEMRALARRLTIDDPEWIESAQRRMKAGEANHLETYFTQLLGGKPKESVDVTVKDVPAELENASDSDLVKIASILEGVRNRTDEDGNSVN